MVSGNLLKFYLDGFFCFSGFCRKRIVEEFGFLFLLKLIKEIFFRCNRFFSVCVRLVSFRVFLSLGGSLGGSVFFTCCLGFFYRRMKRVRW